MVSEAYERQSVVFTTNLEFSRWGTVFGDDQMAAAVIDRVVHHGRLLQFRGESYRVRHSLMLTPIERHRRRPASLSNLDLPPPCVRLARTASAVLQCRVRTRGGAGFTYGFPTCNIGMMRTWLSKAFLIPSAADILTSGSTSALGVIDIITFPKTLSFLA